MNKSNKQIEAKQNCYIPADELIVNDLLLKFKKYFSCSLEPAQAFRTVYYDTFDWRLNREGEMLALHLHDQKQKLSLQKISDGSIVAIVPVPVPFAVTNNKTPGLRSLPSMMCESIAAKVAMRALLPVVKIEGDVQQLLLRDKHEKVVVRLAIEENSTVSAEKVKKRKFQRRILINPVRGYSAELERVRTILKKDPALKPCKLHLLDMALQVIGRRACDYSSKIKLKINPEIQSIKAVKDILQHLLLAMEVNESGMRARLDTEFLHDYRIAVRRTRSILSQMKKVFPQEQFEYFKKEYAWLGAETTPARDLDVYLLGFDTLENRLAENMRVSLQPFREFLQQQQKQAYKELISAVTSARYKLLKKTLKDFIKNDTEESNLEADGKKEIHGHANERIWRSYRRVKKEADRLTPDSPADDFHELRKSCKKLRYLLEFFHNLYHKNKIAKLITQLKILQDNLGEFQDMDVQSHALKEFAEKMSAQGINEADTYMAMGVLADGMEQRKIELQYEFMSLYKHFSKIKYHNLFDESFNSAMKPEQESVNESIG